MNNAPIEVKLEKRALERLPGQQVILNVNLPNLGGKSIPRTLTLTYAGPEEQRYHVEIFPRTSDGINASRPIVPSRQATSYCFFVHDGFINCLNEGYSANLKVDEDLTFQFSR